MRMREWAAAAAPALRRMCAIVLSATLVGACTATVSSAPPPPPIVAATGSVVMDWTLSSTKDPGRCFAAGVATFNVALRDLSGVLVGQWVQDCTAFATTIDGLAPGTYTGQANLLDSGGSPRSTSVNLAPFDVIAATTVTVAVDFPASSLY